jgi:acyl-CoA thioester hydrolase
VDITPYVPFPIVIDNEKIFPITLQLRLDWSEMDMFGHINNISFFKYLQASRVNFWETVGLTKWHEQEKIGAMLASASCNFIAPLHYPGKITIQSRTAYIKNTSFGFHHQILNSEGVVCAEGEDTMVLYDFNKNTKVQIPDHLRQKLEYYLK